MRKIAVIFLIISSCLFTGGMCLKAWAANANTYYGIGDRVFPYTGLGFKDLSNHWARDSVYRLAALGVIRGPGPYFRPEAYISKEEALGMIIRLSGQEGTAQQLNANPAGSGNFTQPWGANYVALAQRSGIITAAEAAQTKWNQSATREEAAYWIARALNIPPAYDRAQQPIYNFRDWTSFNKAKMPYCAAVVGARIIGGRTATLFYPRQGITRAELACALDKASLSYLLSKGFKDMKGVIVYSNSDGATNRAYYRVVGDDGQEFYMAAEPGRDFPVYKNRTPGQSILLAIGDRIRLLAGPTGEVILVEASSGLKVLDGTLDYLDQAKNIIYLTGRDGKSYQMQISPFCKVNLGEYPGLLSDLVPGQPVSLLHNDYQVTEIRSQVSSAAPGALPSEYRTVYGSLFSKNPGELSIRDDDGNPHSYYLAGNARFYINGISSSYYDLRTGDYLKLTLDTSEKVTRVDVRRDSGSYKAYQGRLYVVRSITGEIQFEDLYYYQDGYPSSQGNGECLLEVAQDAQLYDGNHRLTIKDLEAYRGEYAVFATAWRDGREQVVKLVLKGDSERRVSGKVQDINTYLNNFTVQFEPDVITYDEGTIVLKNDRLVDAGAIKAGDSVVVFAERGGSTSTKARLVIIYGKQPSRYEVVKGNLTQVTSNSRFEVDSQDLLEDQEWRDDYTHSTYYYDSTTDFVYADGTTVTRLDDNEFYNRDQDFEDHDIRLISEDGQALAVMVLNGLTFNNEVVTKGAVTSVGSTTITIGDVSNWSSYSNRWDMQPGSMTLNLKYALVVKDGRAVDPARLVPGDPVYIVRGSVSGSPDAYATIVLVEW